MDEINNINSYIIDKLSIIPDLTFYDNNFKVITSEIELEWLNIQNLIDVSQERIWKSEIILTNNEKKNIILKINSSHSLQKEEGKNFIENIKRLNNINSIINNLRQNYSYFNYIHSNIFIKSNIKFTNTKFFKLVKLFI